MPPIQRLEVVVPSWQIDETGTKSNLWVKEVSDLFESKRVYYSRIQGRNGNESNRIRDLFKEKNDGGANGPKGAGPDTEYLNLTGLQLLLNHHAPPGCDPVNEDMAKEVLEQIGNMGQSRASQSSTSIPHLPGYVSVEQFLAWCPLDGTTIFQLTSRQASAIMTELGKLGYGTRKRFGSRVNMSAAILAYPVPYTDAEIQRFNKIEAMKSLPAYKQCWGHHRFFGHHLGHWMFGQGAKDRNSIEEIYQQIASGTERNFSFSMNLIMAAVIASVGLAANSSISTVASMLISPLMGPILGITFGGLIQDWRLFRHGIINTSIAVIQCWVVGFVLGACYSPFAREFNWPTAEMTGRGEIANLMAGIVVATASGVVVGMSVTGGGVNALVGVAISASLLPPIVNAGMLTAFALVGPAIYDCLGQGGIGAGQIRYVKVCSTLPGDDRCASAPVHTAPASDYGTHGAWDGNHLHGGCAPNTAAGFFRNSTTKLFDPPFTTMLDGSASCACTHLNLQPDLSSPWHVIGHGDELKIFTTDMYLSVGWVSLALFFMNFAIIVVMTIVIFHSKKIIKREMSSDDYVLHEDNIRWLHGTFAAMRPTNHDAGSRAVCEKKANHSYYGHLKNYITTQHQRHRHVAISMAQGSTGSRTPSTPGTPGTPDTPGTPPDARTPQCTAPPATDPDADTENPAAQP